MHKPRARLLALFVALIAFVLVSAVLYQTGMSRLEGKPRTFLESLEWAAESLSTTGYGYDSHWSHPAMVLLVIAVQFVGVFLVFLIIPIYLLPFLAERFEQQRGTERVGNPLAGDGPRLPQRNEERVGGRRADMPARRDAGPDPRDGPGRSRR